MAQNVKILPTTPLHLGWIPYWNLLPLRHELNRIAGSEIEFHKGHPSQVNKWLSEGKVSLAPSSSICLLRNSQLEIALPLGIASTGAVQSVYLGVHHEETGILEVIRARQAQLRDIVRVGQTRHGSDVRKLASFIFKMAATLSPVDLELAPPLAVTAASASGAQLARVLYRLWFGETAYELRASETANAGLSAHRPLELVIGDDALVRRAGYRGVVDLGEAWRDLTELPFVFAVWQCGRQPLSPYWRQRILEAAELAQARMRVEPCHYLPDMAVTDCHGRPIDLGAYWRLIHYRLGPTHFRGLALFLALARALQPFAVDDQALVNLMRWENLGAAAQPRM